MRLIAPATLHHLLQSGSELALLDVREHGEYNLAHIPRASSVPRRLLEHVVRRLVPSTNVQIVVCDDDGRRARLAAATLERGGYVRTAVLDGGVNLWASQGLPTEWGMNVPSKDFGEAVEVQHHVPTVDAATLHRWQREGQDLLILDTRTPEEYQRFCIPGGRSVPGGELAYRVADLMRERPGARVVVNCAGRTRSIIGARVLQRMGIPDVVSLKNGTSGWVLAGYQLEAGADRVALPEASAESRAAAEAFARRAAEEDGVQTIDVEALDKLMEQSRSRPVYLLDVRREEEFRAGHIPGFWWFPGGQAVQRADDAVAIRQAPVVMCCDGSARAQITGSWYRQLGFQHVYAVRGGTTAWASVGRSLETGAAEVEPLDLAEARVRVRTVSAESLNAVLASTLPPTVIYVGTSSEFAAGHVPSARWISRGWLELQIDQIAPDRRHPVVLADAHGPDALLAAFALQGMGYVDASAMIGGQAAWRAAGLPSERGLAGVMAPPDDLVPAGPERSTADMINYLRWEEALGTKYA
ncbi:MAG: rhodanese-like domain-containing protein [Chloroflexota bacterium]